MLSPPPKRNCRARRREAGEGGPGPSRERVTVPAARSLGWRSGRLGGVALVGDADGRCSFRRGVATLVPARRSGGRCAFRVDRIDPSAGYVSYLVEREWRYPLRDRVSRQRRSGWGWEADASAAG